MSQIRLLDCTLRDGGFINDWRFGNQQIKQIATGAAAAGIDIIELGFLDSRRPFDPARSIFPDTDGIEKTFEGISFGQSLPVAMIDYGTCPLDCVAPKRESLLAGIRVIFKKDVKKAALAFCAELQAKGYLVFAQPVSVTGYTDEELHQLFQLINEISPCAVSIVDTYGLLKPDTLLFYYALFHQSLLPHIGLGFHAHNNLQLAFANCLALLHAHKKDGGKRTLTLDGSMLGMGKSAGNVPLELLVSHLNQTEHKKYALKPLLSVTQTVISPLYGDAPWGYSLPFFLAAITPCHPQYVFYLVHTLGVNIADTLDVLSTISPDKRLTFDEKHLLTCLKNAQSHAPILTGGNR